MLQHGERLREPAGVPGEIPLAVSMFNVQPDDVTRHVVVIKALVHFQYVSFIPVVPSALVVAQGEERGQCLGACRFIEGQGHIGADGGHPEIEGGLRAKGKWAGGGAELLKMCTTSLLS